LGVAYYQLGDLEKATETFAKAVRVDDDDVVCWVLLGNAYMYRLMLSEAAVALEVAVLKKGSEKDIHRLFKARMWVANWKDRDEMLPKIEQLIQNEIIEVYI
jgi:cytochrome c-type biogenesis protein CcmH/NrfG